MSSVVSERSRLKQPHCDPNELEFEARINKMNEYVRSKAEHDQDASVLSATAPVHPELLRVALAVSRPWWIRSWGNICHSGPHVLSSHQVSLSLPSPSPSHSFNLHGSFIPHRKKKKKKALLWICHCPSLYAMLAMPLGFFPDRAGGA